MGVKNYSVQCRADASCDHFYQTIADKTDGKRLQLQKFANIVDFIMTISHREQGDEFLHVYEKEVRGRNPATTINKDLESMFGALKDDDKMDTTTGLVKVPSLTKPPSIVSLKKKVMTKPKHTTMSMKLTKSINERKRQQRKRKLQKNYLPKLRRENVPETNFILKEMKWTQWELIIAPTIPASESNGTWEKRRGDLKSYKKNYIW